jgi:hypothetical protein
VGDDHRPVIYRRPRRDVGPGLVAGRRRPAQQPPSGLGSSPLDGRQFRGGASDRLLYLMQTPCRDGFLVRHIAEAQRVRQRFDGAERPIRLQRDQALLGDGAVAQQLSPNPSVQVMTRPGGIEGRTRGASAAKPSFVWWRSGSSGCQVSRTLVATVGPRSPGAR